MISTNFLSKTSLY